MIPSASRQPRQEEGRNRANCRQRPQKTRTSTLWSLRLLLPLSSRGTELDSSTAGDTDAVTAVEEAAAAPFKVGDPDLPLPLLRLSYGAGAALGAAPFLAETPFAADGGAVTAPLYAPIVALRRSIAAAMLAALTVTVSLAAPFLLTAPFIAFAVALTGADCSWTLPLPASLASGLCWRRRSDPPCLGSASSLWWVAALSSPERAMMAARSTPPSISAMCPLSGRICTETHK